MIEIYLRGTILRSHNYDLFTLLVGVETELNWEDEGSGFMSSVRGKIVWYSLRGRKSLNKSGNDLKWSVNGVEMRLFMHV